MGAAFTMQATSPILDMTCGKCIDKSATTDKIFFAEENGNIYDDRYCCDGRGGDSLGLRRYSYDYFAHPTEQSTRSIPYKGALHI